MNALPVKIRARLPRNLRWRIEVEPSGCWRWIGALDRDGYPVARGPGGRTARAHRLVYAILAGDVPPGFDLDHVLIRAGLACSRACVNPAHLRPVPPAVNRSRRPPGQLALAFEVYV